MIASPSSLNDSANRAEELFNEHRQTIFRQTDALFARLMLLQWLAGIAVAFLVTPRTWSGQSSQVHIHVWAAIFVGGAISIFPIWMTRVWPGAAITRHVIAVAQMLMSALLIALTGGRLETHFHVFGSLVILSFYRDWRVLIPATIVVAGDHFLRGIYLPYSVYGVLTASPLRSLEHAGWVIFEDIFLVISCLRGVDEMRAIASRTAALETSESGFRELFEEAPIGMAVVGLDERFLNANQALCAMIGYSNEELAERTTEEITHPDDLADGRQAAEALLHGSARQWVEKRYTHKNGDTLWITRTACLIRDHRGDPHHFLVMVEDISLRKRNEAALRESKHHLELAMHTNQLIMDNSQDVICTIDAQGRFVTVSAACEHLWGYTQAELVGREYLEFVFPEDRGMTTDVAAEILVGGRVTDFVNRYIRKDGSVVSVLWSCSWSEKEKIVFCVAHDVTERARNEKELRDAKQEAERANHAKSEFLSRMSHELRTPLNAILGFGQLIERQNPTEAQRTRVGYIINAGRHLLNLINEVLDISRIEAGHLQLSVEPVDAGDALEEAIGLLRPMAAERGTELLTPAALDNTPHVLADRQRLKQVLLNLLTNAVKYTPLGGKVTVSVTSTTGKIRIAVADNGPGIPADKLARLFTAFDRLGAEQTDVEGTGLGLALCQRLSEAMNGSLGVSSTVGNGSTFWLELPSAESPLNRIAATQRILSAPAGAESSRTILYIEDNLSNLRLVEEMLAEQPHLRLITAMQGQLGLDLAKQHRPDLILLDLHLPDLPGWEVLSRLRKKDETREIPVVVLSADATAGQVKRLMAAGARSYLTKPLEVEDLFRTIEEATFADTPAVDCAA